MLSKSQNEQILKMSNKHVTALIDGITSGTNTFSLRQSDVCHFGGLTISHVYLIMGGCADSQGKVHLPQPAGQDVYLQMSLVLYILNASFMNVHMHYKSSVVVFF